MISTSHPGKETFTSSIGPLVHWILGKTVQKIIGINILLVALGLYKYIYQRWFCYTQMVWKSTKPKTCHIGTSWKNGTPSQKLLNAPWVICILARLSAQGPWDFFGWRGTYEFTVKILKLIAKAAGQRMEWYSSNKTTGITVTLPHNWQKRPRRCPSKNGDLRGSTMILKFQDVLVARCFVILI